VFGDLAEVGVAGRQFRPGVADADDRLALELVVGMPWFFIQLRYMKPFLSAVPNHRPSAGCGSCLFCHHC
jgi:hypothetical protein